MKREKTNKATEKTTLNDQSFDQSPPAQTSLMVPTKKGNDEGPGNDAQDRAPEIVPEPDPGQAHAEIHGREGK